MSNIHVRNIDDQLMLDLKVYAEKKSISVNKCIVFLLQKAVSTKHSRMTVQHYFDQFSGSWTQEESDIFEKNTADFSKIDVSLWS